MVITETVTKNDGFDSTYLRALIQETGMSGPTIAEAMGVPYGTLRAYLDGKMSPSLKALLTMADYFAVPIDFLVGRYSKEFSRKIVKNYSRYFMMLRRAPYESYLIGREPKLATKYSSARGEAPWPYNLLNAVFEDETWNDLVDFDHEMEILEMINLLKPNQASFILDYYRDGKTYDEIGKTNSLTLERVRQIVAKGIRTLRCAPLSQVLRYGKAVSIEMGEIAKRKARITIAKKALDEEENRLRKRGAHL